MWRVGQERAEGDDQLATQLDRIRTCPAPLPVVLVGGGSVLVRDRIEGAHEVIRPEHHAFANAIGAAIAQVGGEVDRVFTIDPSRRDEVLDSARQEAVDKAVAAGATLICNLSAICLFNRPSATRLAICSSRPVSTVAGEGSSACAPS